MGYRAGENPEDRGDGQTARVLVQHPVQKEEASKDTGIASIPVASPLVRTPITLSHSCHPGAKGPSGMGTYRVLFSGL